MTVLNRTTVALAICCLCAGSVTAQDYSTMTLNFRNATATNVNQTVNETNNNEKEIDFGDYDNDGDLDVVMAVALSDFGQRRNKLYRNDNGVLNEVSGTSVIPGFGLTDTSRSAFFRDFDNDGFLDIIIINDSNSGTANNDSPGRTKYFRNVNGTSFVNESGRLAGQTGAACNGVAEDFDGNGFCDLIMCNYPNISQDSYTLNNINGAGAGQFTLVTNTNFPSELFYGVHSEAADMNGDGTLDVLVANWQADPSFIYYNDNDITSGVDQNTSAGVGDFRYSATGSQSNFPTGAGTGERTMVPADFNGDGMMDFIFTNAGGFGAPRADVLYINTGNDVHNRATFATQLLSPALNNESIKATCNDLDGDGRPDIIVMSEIRRPYIFRNTSENGEVSFLEWTPAVFTSTHEGWQANSADIMGSDRPDVLVGATNDDFLFENTDSNLINFDDLTAGVLPAFHNSDPIAVTGNINGGETKTLISVGGVEGIPSGAGVSILVRSPGDLSVEATLNGSVVGTSSRPGDDVDEAIHFTTGLAGSVVINVTNEGKGGVLLGDVNGDGMVNLLDVGPFVDLISTGGFSENADFDGDGAVTLLDVQPFIDALASGGSGGGGSVPFVVEILSRSN